MKELEDRIRKDGIVREGNVLYDEAKANTEENIRQMFNSALGDSYTIEFDWRDATE